MKIVYCTPSIYIAGGVERVLTSKVNYLVSRGHDVTIVLTDGEGRQPFYPLADGVKVVNLNIGFEELWTLSFLRKIPVYLRKQRLYRRRLTQTLMALRPDITVTTLRREVNFITRIGDGSKKVGELHITRDHYRSFEEGDTNLIKRLFAWCWMKQLIGKLKRLDRFVVLTHEDMQAWSRDLPRVSVIPNPLPAIPSERSPLTEKRVVAVGRYSSEKGIDLLLRAWSLAEREIPDWRLSVFGAGERAPYQQLARELGLDMGRCELNGAVNPVSKEYLGSSLFVFSSRFEGFGMALLEAMSYGVPAVAFACPCGPKDIVTDGVDGILVENGNVEDMARQIVMLAHDETRRRRMADEAIRKAQRYDIAVIGRQWEELFASI